MAGRAAEKRWLKIAEGILSRPTATCLEDSPAAWIRSFVKRRPGLRLIQDRYGEGRSAADWAAFRFMGRD